MTIFRTEHKKNYTCINNSICKDNRISWKAKGIWLYAFSRPDDWVFNEKDIINNSCDGRDSVRAGLKELQNFGYLHREKIRDSGKYSEVEWVFYETSTLSEVEEKPATENPATVNTATENRPLLSTESLPITEKNKIHTPSADMLTFGSHVKIKKEAYDKLCDKHTQSTIDEVIEEVNDYCAASKPKGYDCYAAAIRTFLRNRKNNPKSVSNTYIDQIKARFKNQEKYNYATCYIDEHAIAFERGSTHLQVRFSDKGFKDQLESILRKFEIR